MEGLFHGTDLRTNPDDTSVLNKVRIWTSSMRGTFLDSGTEISSDIPARNRTPIWRPSMRGLFHGIKSRISRSEAYDPRWGLGFSGEVARLAKA